MRTHELPAPWRSTVGFDRRFNLPNDGDNFPPFENFPPFNVERIVEGRKAGNEERACLHRELPRESGGEADGLTALRMHSTGTRPSRASCCVQTIEPMK